MREISWTLFRRTTSLYSVVTFWQGEYTHNELFGKPCFGEFYRSSPWAVSSNLQLTVLGQYLVTCRRPRLACAPHEGDFLNSLEEDHLPIYSVVTFWRGKYTHNWTFWKTLFLGVFAEQSLGSQLKFSADSDRLPPCYTQSTVARLCSTLHLRVLPKDLLTSYTGLPPWSLCLAIWGRLTSQIILLYTHFSPHNRLTQWCHCYFFLCRNF